MKKSRVLVQLRFDELMPKTFPPPPPRDEFIMERLFNQRIGEEFRAVSDNSKSPKKKT
jgi:hypothetical protein